jgi:hypothetical protein
LWGHGGKSTSRGLAPESRDTAKSEHGIARDEIDRAVQDPAAMAKRLAENVDRMTLLIFHGEAKLPEGEKA